MNLKYETETETETLIIPRNKHLDEMSFSVQVAADMAQAPNPIDVATVEAALVQQGVPPPVVPAPAPMENNNVSLVVFLDVQGLSELLF